MIADRPNIQDAALLTILNLDESKHLFYPCGSRYFGYFSPESDYDFFFEKSRDVSAYLLDNCFVAANMHSCYMDVNTLGIFSSGQVHVMEVKSAKNRMAVQDYIFTERKKSESPDFRPPKGDRDWWNKRYCEIFPGEYEMPMTAEERRQAREESRGAIL